MSLINVSVINASSVLADSDVQPVVDALQKQVDNDFGPAWGVGAKLNFVPQGGSPPAGSPQATNCWKCLPIPISI